MKKIIAPFFLVFFACTILSAQENKTEIKTEGQTSFYAELGGPGILFSANVDRRFKQSRFGWGGRIGLGFVSFYDEQYVNGPGGGYYTGGDQISVVTIPVQINYIFGKGNTPHSFEVGAGVTVAGRKLDVFDYYDENKASVFGTASFMYRRQPAGGGFSWRAGFTPIVAKGYIQPFGGVSVGYNF